MKRTPRRRNPDPRGRIDILAYRIAERLAQRHPLTAALWPQGLGQAVEALIAEALPARPLIPAPRRRLCLPE